MHDTCTSVHGIKSFCMLHLSWGMKKSHARETREGERGHDNGAINFWRTQPMPNNP